MSTTLHDRLEDAVSDVSADLGALTTASRKQGLGIRRRRRALATVGTAAAVTVLAVTGYAVRPGATDTAVLLDRPPTTELSGRTAPITPAGTAAALAAAVDEVADGTLDRFQGDVSDGEAMAALLFKPLGSNGPAGQVFVNLQPAAMAGDAPYSCAGYLVGSISDCTSRELPNGTYLRTYRMDDDTEFGEGSRYVAAEVIDPARGLRVLVSARNNNPWAAGSYQAEAVLAVHGLTEIARKPWWSTTELPVEYVEAGQDVHLYQG